MSLQSSDLFIVERGGVQYKMDADQLKTFVRVSYIVADIAARDALSVGAGTRVLVQDASADSTVDSGFAVYWYDGTSYIKTAEGESLDVTVAPTNLGYTPASNQGTVTSSTGTNAVIPAVDGTNAGLATPTMFNNTHPAANTAGTAATNPVAINAGTQQISFSISGLSSLP